MVGYIYIIEVNITQVDHDENYSERKILMPKIYPDTPLDVRDNGEITHKSVYDELLSDNQSKKNTFISIKRRSAEPEDFQLNTTMEFDQPKAGRCIRFIIRSDGWYLEAGAPKITFQYRPFTIVVDFPYSDTFVIQYKPTKGSLGSIRQWDVNSRVHYARFYPILANSVIITIRILVKRTSCVETAAFAVNVLGEMYNFHFKVASKDQFLVNTMVNINIFLNNLESLDIYFDVSCDGVKVASIKRSLPPMATTTSTYFTTAGRHICFVTAYIKGKPDLLRQMYYRIKNTKIMDSFIITNRMTMFKYDMEVDGAYVASSSNPYKSQIFLQTSKNITVYFISDGYNTTFSLIVYPYQDADARLTAKKHYIAGAWNATSQRISAKLIYSSSSSGSFTIALQADNVVSRHVSNITANFRERITPFEIQASYYQKIRTLVRFNLASHNGDFISYHWKIGAGFSKVTRTATLLHIFNNELGNANISVFASNNLSSYSRSKSIYVYKEIEGLQAIWSANSFVFCVPSDIQIRGIAKGGRNVICDISSGSRTLYHDIARPRAPGGEMIVCNTTFNLSSIGFYNFTVKMYNSVNMTQVQVRSIEGIASDSNPFKVNMTSAISTVETDAVFIITGDSPCPLLRCDFDFGDGNNGTFQHVSNRSSHRHRYTKMGHYKVSGMLKFLV
eukprot:Seg4066.1 transcript_id=Seg4066.1/GoldUCD/mRNA.D3Y31 product=Polycystin-1 protein_id=Seg4066.1/GoldUCD/D3Y31